MARPRKWKALGQSSSVMWVVVGMDWSEPNEEGSEQDEADTKHGAKSTLALCAPVPTPGAPVTPRIQDSSEVISLS